MKMTGTNTGDPNTPHRNTPRISPTLLMRALLVIGLVTSGPLVGWGQEYLWVSHFGPNIHSGTVTRYDASGATTGLQLTGLRLVRSLAKHPHQDVLYVALGGIQNGAPAEIARFDMETGDELLPRLTVGHGYPDSTIRHPGDIAFTSTGDLYVIGNAGPANWNFVQRYDGTSWQLVHTVNQDPEYAIWAFALTVDAVDNYYWAHGGADCPDDWCSNPEWPCHDTGDCCPSRVFKNDATVATWLGACTDLIPTFPGYRRAPVNFWRLTADTNRSPAVLYALEHTSQNGDKNLNGIARLERGQDPVQIVGGDGMVIPTCLTWRTSNERLYVGYGKQVKEIGRDGTIHNPAFLQWVPPDAPEADEAGRGGAIQGLQWVLMATGPQACCYPNGACADIEAGTCQATGGVDQGPDTQCAEVTCPLITGACCSEAAVCTEVLEESCASNPDLIWVGPNTDCQDNNDNDIADACEPYVLQACCHNDGSCLDDWPDACQAADGVPQGQGTTCATTECPVLTGACCLSDGNCQITLPTECADIQGTWMGADTSCDLCAPVPRACCLPGGTCLDVWSEDDCLAQNGVPQEPNSECATVTCPGDVFIWTTQDTRGAFKGLDRQGNLARTITDHDAQSLAIGPDERLYVSSPGDHGQVYQHDLATGQLIGEFSTGRTISNPMGMTFGPDGHLYVAAYHDHAVLRFDGTTGAFIDEFIADEPELEWPLSVTFGGSGNYAYVSEQLFDGRVLRFNSTTGNFVDELLRTMNVNAYFHISIEADGLLYVAGLHTDNVVRFDPDTGEPLDAFVTPASGGLDGPVTFAFGGDGYFYVTSVGTNAILRYHAADGSYDGVFAGAPALDAPTYLAVVPGDCEPPAITTPPTDAELCVGETLTLTTEAIGSAPLQYTWHRDDSELPGQTDATLTIPNVTEASAGAYTVTVMNSCGTTTSDAAQVTVWPTPQPVIMATPGAIICEGQAVSLDAGAGFATYLWSPSGSTTRVIDVTSAGTYTVKVTDEHGCEGSAAITITVCDPSSGDFNCDGVVNLADHQKLVGCLTGPGTPVEAGPCSWCDANADGYVDLRDYARLQQVFAGG